MGRKNRGNKKAAKVVITNVTPTEPKLEEPTVEPKIDTQEQAEKQFITVVIGRNVYVVYAVFGGLSDLNETGFARFDYGKKEAIPFSSALFCKRFGTSLRGLFRYTLVETALGTNSGGLIVILSAPVNIGTKGTAIELDSPLNVIVGKNKFAYSFSDDQVNAIMSSQDYFYSDSKFTLEVCHNSIVGFLTFTVADKVEVHEEKKEPLNDDSHHARQSVDCKPAPVNYAKLIPVTKTSSLPVTAQTKVNSDENRVVSLNPEQSVAKILARYKRIEPEEVPIRYNGEEDEVEKSPAERIEAITRFDANGVVTITYLPTGARVNCVPPGKEVSHEARCRETDRTPCDNFNCYNHSSEDIYKKFLRLSCKNEDMFKHLRPIFLVMAEIWKLNGGKKSPEYLLDMIKESVWYINPDHAKYIGSVFAK